MAKRNVSKGRTRTQQAWRAAQLGGLDSVTVDGEGVSNGPFLRGERGGMPLSLRMFEGLRGEVRRLSVLCPGVSVELSVRPELAGERIDKVLGMTIDHEVGDPAFDPKFVIEACPMEMARELLTNTVRRALLELPRDAEYPRLSLRDGELTISWRGEASDEAVTGVFEAASVVHEKARELRETGPAVSEASPFRTVVTTERAVNPTARERARSLVKGARRRATLVLSTTGLVSVAAIAAALFGGGAHHQTTPASAAMTAPGEVFTAR